MISAQSSIHAVAQKPHRARTPHRAHPLRITPWLLGPARTPNCSRAVISLASLLALTLAGCGTHQVPRVEDQRGVLTTARLANSSSLAPATQRVERAPADALAFLPAATERDLDGVDPSAFAEYARNDARAAPAGSNVILATNQWPTPEPVSLERQRRIFVGTQNTFLFFLPDDTRYRRTYWR